MPRPYLPSLLNLPSCRTVRVVGDHPSLGNWDAAKGLELETQQDCRRAVFEDDNGKTQKSDGFSMVSHTLPMFLRGITPMFLFCMSVNSMCVF